MYKRVISLLSAFLIIVTVVLSAPAAFAATSGDYTYEIRDGLLYITGYSGSAETVTVPAQLDGTPVYSIDTESMKAKNFKNLIISEGIKVLGSSAFEYNQKLESVVLPDSLTEIGTMAFNGCPKLDEITIPKNVEKIGSYAFWCAGLTSINTSDQNKYYKSVSGVLYTKDGKCLVAYPGNRTGAYTVENGTQEILTAAFMNSRVESVYFPDSTQKIGLQAFSGCADLKTVSLASGLKTIGNRAFSKCSSLKTLNIPDGCEELGDSFIANCTSLSTLTLPISITTFSDKVFGGINSNINLYIPQPGAVSDAASKAGMSVNFTDIGDVQSIIDRIAALTSNDITLKDEDEINDIRSAYRLLNSAKKALVTNYADFEAAEKQLEELKLPIKEVISMINKLGVIYSLEQKPQVEAAREAYNALSDDAREQVVNLPILESAERVIADLENGIDVPVFKLGDMDDNGVLNVSDIMSLKNIIMTGTNDTDVIRRGDMDGNGVLNVSDMLSLKNIIMVQS